MERMERRWSQLTPADVQLLADNTPPEKFAYGGPFGFSPYMVPELDILNGKSFAMTFSDGTKLNYRFVEKHKLFWSENGSEEREEFCQVHLCPGTDYIYFVNHYVHGSKPPRAMTLVIDSSNGLVTAVDAHIGVPNSAIEVGRTFRFGRIDGSDESIPLHSWTNDMIGTAIIWDYGPKAPGAVKHIYTMPMYYSYVMINGDKCWTASNPADYVKIADNIYIFGFVEERQGGMESVFLMNLKEMHDVGAFFGIGMNGLSCKTVGAKGTYSTMYTVFDR